jgi:hypothetical protein
VAETAKLRGAISFTFCSCGTDRVGAVLDDEDDVVVIINWGANAPPLFSLEAKCDPSPVGEDDVTLRLTTPFPVTREVMDTSYQVLVVTGPSE